MRSVHPPEELLPAAQELARSFVKGRSPVALGLAKQLLYRHAGSAEPLEAHLSDSLGVFWTLTGGRQGGRGGVPGEAARGVHGQGLRAAPDRLTIRHAAACAPSSPSSSAKCRSAPASWYIEVSAIV